MPGSIGVTGGPVDAGAIPATQATDAEVAAALALLPVTSLQNPAGTPITGKRIVIDTVVGPASYAAGGFEVDLSARFSSLLFVAATVEVIGTILPPTLTRITLNSSGAGKFKIALFTAANVELAALTVLSAATWRYLALGTP